MPGVIGWRLGLVFACAVTHWKECAVRFMTGCGEREIERQRDGGAEACGHPHGYVDTPMTDWLPLML